MENLTLDGQGQLGQTVTGITNGFSQNGTFVNHVSLYQVFGTGLLVEASNGGNASSSGPYSNITFDTGTSAVPTSTVCAQILNLTSTHGIHSLTCKSESNDANAAVLLDSSNNSIEDVRIVGFYDGIRVGYNHAALSNVLMNVYGDTDRKLLSLVSHTGKRDSHNRQYRKRPQCDGSGERRRRAHDDDPG